MTRRAIVLVCLLLAVAAPGSAVRLRILYTNDLHARLDRLASIEEVIASARAIGDPVLLVDAGDAWQDFRLAAAVTGADRPVEEWMSRVGYAAMVPGNHDFYVGWSEMQSLERQAAFPILCANLAPVDGTPPPFARSLRATLGGLEVLIVGITALEFLPALDIPWLRPVDAADAVRQAIAGAEPAPDLVVCLAHIPVREAADLARAVSGIDVIVSGHSHEATPAPVVVGRTLIVQSGAFGRAVGDLLLDVQDGSVRQVHHILHPTTEEAEAYPGPGLARLLSLSLWVVLFLALVFA